MKSKLVQFGLPVLVSLSIVGGNFWLQNRIEQRHERDAFISKMVNSGESFTNSGLQFVKDEFHKKTPNADLNNFLEAIIYQYQVIDYPPSPISPAYVQEYKEYLLKLHGLVFMPNNYKDNMAILQCMKTIIALQEKINTELWNK